MLAINTIDVCISQGSVLLRTSACLRVTDEALNAMIFPLIPSFVRPFIVSSRRRFHSACNDILFFGFHWTKLDIDNVVAHFIIVLSSSYQLTLMVTTGFLFSLLVKTYIKQ